MLLRFKGLGGTARAGNGVRDPLSNLSAESGGFREQRVGSTDISNLDRVLRGIIRPRRLLKCSFLFGRRSSGSQEAADTLNIIFYSPRSGRRPSRASCTIFHLA